MLRHHHHEKEAFFVREHVEMEHLLRYGMISDRLVSTNALFQKQYEVPNSIYGDVSRTIIYFSNLISLESVCTSKVAYYIV